MFMYFMVIVYTGTMESRNRIRYNKEQAYYAYIGGLIKKHPDILAKLSNQPSSLSKFSSILGEKEQVDVSILKDINIVRIKDNFIIYDNARCNTFITEENVSDVKYDPTNGIYSTGVNLRIFNIKK